ncbi:uncharacterized protein LOC131149576 isoform X1 [Malania oleifera]|uniref:uncharacterized protein LOC131149576 isoform X1 n=1 Tax=Malania oleifera TaxID=397392 RepID=UPI0025AE7C96|nr:uncharacterized protein LOC131149576 isoform X1 [Malania oleifera]
MEEDSLPSVRRPPKVLKLGEEDERKMQPRQKRHMDFPTTTTATTSKTNSSSPFKLPDGWVVIKKPRPYAQGHRSDKDAEGFNEKPAYLFRSIVNVTIEEPEFKMVGGQQYSAADVHCNRCLRPLGWKIVKVMYPPSQDFKEGRFLLDKAKIDDWDEVELDPPPGSSGEESMSTPVAATSEERESVAEACE